MNLPYQQASGVSDGEELQTVTGMCTAVYPQEQRGKALLQNIALTVQGCPLKVSLFGLKISHDAKGKEVTFTSTGGRYGTIKYSIYNGKEQLTIGNKAAYEIVDHGSSGNAHSTAPAASYKPSAAKAGPIPQNDTQEAFLTRLTDFHYKCFKAVEETYPGMLEGNPVMFQGFVSSIFITADRAGVQHFPCEPSASRKSPPPNPGGEEDEIPMW